MSRSADQSEQQSANQASNQASKRASSSRPKLLLLVLLVAISLIAVALVGVFAGDQERVDRATSRMLAEGVGLISKGVMDVLGEIEDTHRVPIGLRSFDQDLGAWVEIDGWVPSSSRAVLLIHGLDEPGGIWDQLAPALATEGHAVLRFDYRNDQAIGLSADELEFSLKRLTSVGIEELDLVCHSMGGLVARDAISRMQTSAQEEDGSETAVMPRYGTMITLGTPHGGSAWARLRSIAEAREQVQRWAESDDMDPARLLGFLDDGSGQAGIDLLPGSAYLVELDARTLPHGMRVVCVVGRADEASTRAGAVSATGARQAMRELLGERQAGVVLDELDRLGRELGDGVVAVSSAAMPGADEVIEVRANHRSMIRTIELGQAMRRMNGLDEGPEPPAIAIVVERLRRD